MKNLEKIAADFLHSFYKKEWKGDNHTVTNLSVVEAYQVQDIISKKRTASGERIIGYKIGCTSSAIQKQFGLKEPINGKLFHPFTTNNHTTYSFSNYINLAIEPEMVFKIEKSLRGHNLSNGELIEAIEYVSPGIELHEFNFWIQPTSIQELICSGGIHTGLLIGAQKVSPKDLNFSDEAFSVYKNDALVTYAKAAEIMGSPLNSLRWLVNFLTERNSCLEKGSFVIPGSPVELINIDQPVELTIEIDKVGLVTTQFTNG